MVDLVKPQTNVLSCYISMYMYTNRPLYIKAIFYKSFFVQMLLVLKLTNLLLLCLFEVLSFHLKKTPAERSYISALCRILVSLQFRLSEQGAIKLMRVLLNRVLECISIEKDLLKELKRMSEHLKGVDKHPDKELSQDEANLIFGKNSLMKRMS